MDVDVLDLDEIEDIEDLAESICYDSDEIPAEAYSDFPDDFVIAICSLRGTGKSALLAYYELNGLRNGEHIFTNLPLFPERAGIKQTPDPLVLDQLLSFDPVLDKAVIGIEELHTWIQRKRPMSTSAIMADEFLRQLRKRVIRVIFTDQSVSLPRDVERDVDMFIQGMDMRWTDYGRDNNLPKGTLFLYQATDYSARFTGHRFRTWQFTLQFANRLWSKFDSYKIYDPFEAFKRVKMVGGEREFDLDTRKLYLAGEREAQVDTAALQRHFLLLQAFWRSFELDLLPVAKESKAIIDDYEDRLVLSVGKLRNSIAQLRGNRRQAAERQYNDLRTIAAGGHMARFGIGRKTIELKKPILNSMESEPAAPAVLIEPEIREAIRDLHTTGYRDIQIAHKLKISEQAVCDVLYGETDE